MFGNYRTTDISGKKWHIEYNLLVWREDWDDWDFYTSGDRQRDLFADIDLYLINENTRRINDSLLHTFSVEVALCCGAGANTNRAKIFNLDGTEWIKPNSKL